MVADSDFPSRGSGREKLGFAIRQAMLQSGQQYWRSVEFFIREQFVEVSARHLPAAAVGDPEGRDRLIHCGLALQHLKLTLKRHGCFGRIDLFPDLDQPDLAARIYPGNGEAGNDSERQMVKALAMEEGSHRLPTPISDAALDWLSRAASRERSWLEYPRCEGSRQMLTELVCAPPRVQGAAIQIQSETISYSTSNRWKLARIAGERLARWRKPALAIRVTTSPVRFETNKSVAPEGTYAVLKTKTDDKHGWLAAGQTLAGLLLHSRALGLSCTPFLNALRQPELRAELRTAIGHKGFMQVILCFSGPKAELFAGMTERYATMASRPSP
jgi:hypothetical protein